MMLFSNFDEEEHFHFPNCIEPKNMCEMQNEVIYSVV